MSLTDYVPFYGNTTEEEAPTLEALEAMFRKREATLDLTAEFHQPNGNAMDEPTAVFPYTLLDAEGEVYGTGCKEFIVPDNGFKDDDANVTEFVGGLTDTPASEVGIAALRAIEGSTADAELNDDGDIIVNVPNAPEIEEAEEAEETADDEAAEEEEEE